MTLSIDKLYAYIAVDTEGKDGKKGEGITSFYNPDTGGWMPMIGADQKRIESLRPLAQSMANESGQRIVLASFDVRTDVEILEPDGTGAAGVVILGTEEAAAVAGAVESIRNTPREES